ncbi:LPS export ABC transporter permease LptF [Psychrosphaera sp. B3R10]|uniref:LPS export ABC transporter permease LptF n=1 Tax=unclassified Psychrosphaera TaxID=2641570 RepID=UPI001C0805E2|nr:LPS export ABC transporter permease LptF [Psychrosphaera sp. 1_MG-2023]MBU2883916.1 LPS export ABC transporter permease LptF [Psychrosphaera sp. I2R16]MBU2991575.1 LPS export ABC transporter permease LptF [Psychrosphaera sp. B3R10]MDO6719205.1 LPS export ABC transporter permease LptF [Psychrosphaera sp. 1_MG-2023]
MIILRYLTAEVFKSQFAVFLVFMSIFMSQTFVRVLADASEGKIPGYLVLSIIGLRFPQLAAIILPLSMFLGVMLAYGRLYADQEMSVLKATGVSEWYVTRVTLVLATMVAIFGGVITMYLAPLATEYEYQVRENAAAEGVLSTLTAGRFQQAGNVNSVVFVHEIERDTSMMKKVFVAQGNDNGVQSVVYALNGQLKEQENGEQDLVLSGGQRYFLSEDEAPQRLTFSEYQILMEDQAIERRRRNYTALPTLELMKSNELEAVAEFQWRLAIPLTIPILAMIAVPLSSVNPRQGRFGKIMPGLGLFFAYYILLVLAKSALEDGKIPPQIGLWWIHLFGLFTAILLLLRDRSFGGKVRKSWLSLSSKGGA